MYHGPGITTFLKVDEASRISTGFAFALRSVTRRCGGVPRELRVVQTACASKEGSYALVFQQQIQYLDRGSGPIKSRRVVEMVEVSVNRPSQQRRSRAGCGSSRPPASDQASNSTSPSRRSSGPQSQGCQPSSSARLSYRHVAIGIGHQWSDIKHHQEQIRMRDVASHMNNGHEDPPPESMVAHQSSHGTTAEANNYAVAADFPH